MKKVRYTISKKAELDIEAIWDFTAEKWSPEQADRYIRLIIEEVEYICGNPGSGRSVDHIRKGYRASKVKSHLILYRQTSPSVIEVVRILHERMDIENRMRE